MLDEDKLQTLDEARLIMHAHQNAKPKPGFLESEAESLALAEVGERALRGEPLPGWLR